MGHQGRLKSRELMDPKEALRKAQKIYRNMVSLGMQIEAAATTAENLLHRAEIKAGLRPGSSAPDIGCDISDAFDTQRSYRHTLEQARHLLGIVEFRAKRLRRDRREQFIAEHPRWFGTQVSKLKKYQDEMADLLLMAKATHDQFERFSPRPVIPSS